MSIDSLHIFQIKREEGVFLPACSANEQIEVYSGCSDSQYVSTLLSSLEEYLTSRSSSIAIISGWTIRSIIFRRERAVSDVFDINIALHWQSSRPFSGRPPLSTSRTIPYPETHGFIT